VSDISIRLGLAQRVLPAYRVPFFDTLAAACDGGLELYAGQPRPEEMIEGSAIPQTARLTQGRNLHLLRGKAYFCWQRGLIAWLQNADPGALIAEANPRYLSTPPAVRWMHAHGRPVIGWGLGAPAANILSTAFRRPFLNQFDAFITYSRQGAEEYAAAGIDPQRIFVAPNAVTPRPTHPAPQRPLTFNGKACVLFVGRLQARKRIDLLLQACAALPSQRQPRLVIVGEGPVRAELEQLAAAVYPTAEFAGAKHGAELEPYFTAADLFVLPGTGGLAVQQAMSYGLPVLVAEADGTQSDLVRPQNGRVLPPGDLPALTAAIAATLSDLPGLRRMGAESYKIVSQEINLEAMLAAFARAVRFVLEQ
jgi:glycosyltransferase involved in cell wall biosynthesis